MKIHKIIPYAGLLCLCTCFSTLFAQTSAFANYDKSGSYSVEKIRNTGPNKTHDIFRPTNFKSSNKQHAIITWGNGTSASVTSYAGLLQHLATHGFVVIASQSGSTGSGSEIAEGADWLLTENARSGSDYYQKLNTQGAGATGHSQGGAGTIQSLKHTDKINSIAPLAPATFASPFYYSTSHVKIPMFLMIGSNDNLANPASVRTTSWGSFGKNETGLYGEIEGATHFEATGDAGKFRKYVTAWFDATLNKNPQAVAMIFNDSNGALHKSPTEWSKLLFKNLDLFTTAAVHKPGKKVQSRWVRFESSDLILQIPQGEKFSVNVYDIRGVMVYKKVLSESGKMHLSRFETAGGYIMTVKHENEVIFQRTVFRL